MLQPPKKPGNQRGKLFVNGEATTAGYNFKTPTLGQREACDCDHLEERKLTELLREPIQDALLSCQFAWTDVLNRFFPCTCPALACIKRCAYRLAYTLSIDHFRPLSRLRVLVHIARFIMAGPFAPERERQAQSHCFHYQTC